MASDREYAVIIYELTLSEREFRGEGDDFSALFLKAIHVISSMCKRGEAIDKLMEYIDCFYSLDLRDPASGIVVIKRINEYLNRK